MMRANGSFAVDLTFVLSKGGGICPECPMFMPVTSEK